MSVPTTVPMWKRLLAGALGLASGGILLWNVDGSDRWQVVLPSVLLAVAAVTIHVPRLGPQMLARAVWWSNLGLGAILSLLGGSAEHVWGFALGALCGAALLVIGGRGVDEAGERSAYAPAAFRGSLLLLMVLVLADAQTFALLAILTANRSSMEGAVLLVVAACALAVAFVGLYRLAVWGVVVAVATCAAVLLASLTNVLGWSDGRHIAEVLSALEIAAAAPMVTALVTRRSLPHPGPRVRAAATNGIVVLVMAASAYCAFVR